MKNMPKFCKDCENIIQKSEEVFVCRRFHIEPRYDLVTGIEKSPSDYFSCQLLRMPDGFCGPLGRYYKAKK